MTKYDNDFDAWFDLLKLNLEENGIQFNDQESVRFEYEQGKDLYVVADEIKAEYAD